MPHKIHFLFCTLNNPSNTLKCQKCINELVKIINLGAINGPVGWNGLIKGFQKHPKVSIYLVKEHLDVRKKLISAYFEKLVTLAPPPLYSTLCVCRWMFWSDWGLEPKIERAGMDGSHREIIIKETVRSDGN